MKRYIAPLICVMLFHPILGQSELLKTHLDVTRPHSPYTVGHTEIASKGRIPEVTPQQKHTTLAMIRLHIERNNFHALGKELEQHLGTTITLQDALGLAQELSCTPLRRALSVTKKIQALGEQIRVRQGNLARCALFVETELVKHVSNQRHYFAANATGFDFTVEHDPASDRTFLHPKKSTPFASGKKKEAFLSVLYHRSHPELVARCVTSHDISEEIAALKALKGAPGVMEAYAFTERQNKSGKKENAIIAPFYQPGELYQVIKSGDYKLTFKEKLGIATDLLRGLESMHERNFAHRDLGPRNHLVHIGNGRPGKRTVRAVVADMGRSMPVHSLSGVSTQGNAYFAPPESVFSESLQLNDYHQSDIYALGTVLHWLYKEQFPQWINRNYIRNTRPAAHDRHKAYVRRIQHMHQSIRESIASVDKGDPHRQFQELILQMTDTNPHQRGSARAMRERCEAIHRSL